MRLRWLCSWPSRRPRPAANTPPPEYVQAVEFPYYLYPRALWERELVVAQDHRHPHRGVLHPLELAPAAQGGFDFTGRTSPRRDLLGLIKICCAASDCTPGFVPCPPAADWPNAGAPSGRRRSPRSAPGSTRSNSCWPRRPRATAAPSPRWKARVVSIDAPRAAHAGQRPSGDRPRRLRCAAAKPSSPPAARCCGPTWKTRSIPPAGQPTPGSLLRNGASGLSGDERAAAVALRRDARCSCATGRRCCRRCMPVAMPKPAAGKFPDGVTAVELISPAISAVSVTNQSAQPFHDELRVFEPRLASAPW